MNLRTFVGLDSPLNNISKGDLGARFDHVTNIPVVKTTQPQSGSANAAMNLYDDRPMFEDPFRLFRRR